MRHLASAAFWDAFGQLPAEIQSLAKKNFKLLKQNSSHPSLHLKRVGQMWSVRVGSGHRAVGVDAADGIVWIWIGTHAEYDRFIRS